MVVLLDLEQGPLYKRGYMDDSKRTFASRDGGDFPTIGLGTWKIPDEVLPTLIPEAVAMGYRHFDCACDYGNEVSVGKGLSAALSGGQVSRMICGSHPSCGTPTITLNMCEQLAKGRCQILAWTNSTSTSSTFR